MIKLNLEAPLRWLAEQSDVMVRQLIAWAEINSCSRNLAGLQQMAASLQQAFERLNADCQRIPLRTMTEVDEQGNFHTWQTVPALRWSSHPKAPKQVLLGIHFDTVYSPTDANPSCQWIDGNRLTGPGVADAKGGIVVILWALQALQKFGLNEQLGWTVALNPDEELGSPASAELWQQLASQFDFGLLFEPSLPDGALVSQRPASGNFTIVVRGKSAHVGRNPLAGRNAITRAARIAVELEQLNQPVEGLTINVGVLRGGGPLNRVPDLAVLKFNARTNSSTIRQRFELQLQMLLEQHCTSDGFRFELHGGFHAPEKPLDATAKILQESFSQACETLGTNLLWRATGGVCDGNKLAAAGLPNLDTLGPTGDGLHSPHEYVVVDTLVTAAQRTLVFLAQYAAGDFPQLTRGDRASMANVSP